MNISYLLFFLFLSIEGRILRKQEVPGLGLATGDTHDDYWKAYHNRPGVQRSTDLRKSIRLGLTSYSLSEDALRSRIPLWNIMIRCRLCGHSTRFNNMITTCAPFESNENTSPQYGNKLINRDPDYDFRFSNLPANFPGKVACEVNNKMPLVTRHLAYCLFDMSAATADSELLLNGPSQSYGGRFECQLRSPQGQPLGNSKIQFHVIETFHI